MLDSIFNMKKAAVRGAVRRYNGMRTRRIKLPNFYEEARKDRAGVKIGDALLKRLLADQEALS